MSAYWHVPVIIAILTFILVMFGLALLPAILVALAILTLVVVVAAVITGRGSGVS